MNAYKAFWKNKTCEVIAETSYAAQKKAAEEFNAKKTHEVTVMLMEKDGIQIIRKPDF